MIIKQVTNMHVRHTPFSIITFQSPGHSFSERNRICIIFSHQQSLFSLIATSFGSGKIRSFLKPLDYNALESHGNRHRWNRMTVGPKCQVRNVWQLKEHGIKLWDRKALPNCSLLNRPLTVNWWFVNDRLARVLTRVICDQIISAQPWKWFGLGNGTIFFEVWRLVTKRWIRQWIQIAFFSNSL